MTMNNETIASLILLGKKGTFVPWKMAFDEQHGNYSPGMQIMLEATESLISQKSFVEADSLAVADHWMMNRIWPDKIAITDFAVSLAPNSVSRLELFITSKLRFHKIKMTAKEVLSRINSIRGKFQ